MNIIKFGSNTTTKTFLFILHPMKFVESASQIPNSKYYIYSVVPVGLEQTIQRRFLRRNDESWLLASISTMKSLITSFLLQIYCEMYSGACVIPLWYHNSSLNPSFVVNEWMPSREWLRLSPKNFKTSFWKYELKKIWNLEIFNKIHVYDFVSMYMNIFKMNFLQKMSLCIDSHVT